MSKHSALYLLIPLALIGCVTDEADLAADGTGDEYTDEQESELVQALASNVLFYDAVVWHGSDVFGYSQNVLRGPRQCAGRRVSRSVARTYGTGSCDAVYDLSNPAYPIFWANELCARNPNMYFGNSTITQACQEYFNGGPSLGDNDCRYIVHIGAAQYVPPFQPANETSCQPSHVAQVDQSFSFSAANTNNATTNTTDRSIVLYGGQTLTIGTCGVAGSSFSGDTYLRLNSPLGYPFYGSTVAANDDACGGLGSRLVYTAAYGGSYTIRAGCYANNSCAGTVSWTIQ